MKIDRPCSACGARIRTSVQIPAGRFSSILRSWAKTMSSPDSMMYCDPCEERMEREEAEAQRAARVDDARERSGVPLLLQKMNWDDIEVDPEREEAIRAARSWSTSPAQPGVFLWGEWGVGKTRIAAAAAEQWLQGGGRVRWLSVATLLTDLALPFSHPRYARALDALQAEKTTLILDDFDKVAATDRAVQPLFVALEESVNSGRPFLITANRDLDELAEWAPESFGHALSSRIAGNAVVAQVGGRDRRLDE